MSFKLKILGSNAAAPAFNRNQTSQLLLVNNHYFLIDCGEGTQVRISKARVKLNKIDHILISHLHGDHYFGLIGLLSTMHLFGRTKPLKLFCPSALKEIIDIQFRHSETILNFPIDYLFTDLHQGDLIFENSDVTLEKFQLDHRIFCTGFIFRQKPAKRKIIKEKLPAELKYSDILKLKDGYDIFDENNVLLFKNSDLTYPSKKTCSYAFCSDTKYNEEISEKVKGVDMIYHEATFTRDMKDRAAETFHSTAEEAALIAKKAQAGKLLIGHFSVRYRELEPLLSEAKEIFSETFLAIEGETFEIT